MGLGDMRGPFDYFKISDGDGVLSEFAYSKPTAYLDLFNIQVQC